MYIYIYTFIIDLIALWLLIKKCFQYYTIVTDDSRKMKHQNVLNNDIIFAERKILVKYLKI